MKTSWSDYLKHRDFKKKDPTQNFKLKFCEIFMSMCGFWTFLPLWCVILCPKLDLNCRNEKNVTKWTKFQKSTSYLLPPFVGNSTRFMNLEFLGQSWWSCQAKSKCFLSQSFLRKIWDIVEIFIQRANAWIISSNSDLVVSIDVDWCEGFALRIEFSNWCALELVKKGGNKRKRGIKNKSGCLGQLMFLRCSEHPFPANGVEMLRYPRHQETLMCVRDIA